MSALSCEDGVKLAGTREVASAPSLSAARSRVKLCHWAWGCKPYRRILPLAQAAKALSIPGVRGQTSTRELHPTPHHYGIPGLDPALLTWRMTPFLSRLCFLAVMTK